MPLPSRSRRSRRRSCDRSPLVVRRGAQQALDAVTPGCRESREQNGVVRPCSGEVADVARLHDQARDRSVPRRPPTAPWRPFLSRRAARRAGVAARVGVAARCWAHDRLHRRPTTALGVTRPARQPIRRRAGWHRPRERAPRRGRRAAAVWVPGPAQRSDCDRRARRGPHSARARGTAWVAASDGQLTKARPAAEEAVAGLLVLAGAGHAPASTSRHCRGRNRNRCSPVDVGRSWRAPREGRGRVPEVASGCRSAARDGAVRLLSRPSIPARRPPGAAARRPVRHRG